MALPHIVHVLVRPYLTSGDFIETVALKMGNGPSEKDEQVSFVQLLIKA